MTTQEGGVPREADSVGRLSTSSEAQASARTRRRVRKRNGQRNGPPQLQFVTATDPSEFKNSSNKRSVRSQAMIQYRYQADQLQKKGKGKGAGVVPGPSNAGASSQSAAPASAGSPMGGMQVPANESVGVWVPPPIAVTTEAEQQLYASTSAAWWATNPGTPGHEYADAQWGSPYQPGFVNSPAGLGAQYRAVPPVLPKGGTGRVTDYEETEAHEENMMRMLADELAIISLSPASDGVDPFYAFPRFESQELNSMDLVRRCIRAFVSPATMAKWAPAMMAHPHILLSSTTLAATWLDMHAGRSGDTKRTLLVKSEVIGWVNQRLRDATQQFEDSTLMVILHLLVGEMWSCNESTLRIHEKGVARLIAHRGGMDKLGGNGAMAEVAASCCLHADIFCEATPLPIFQKWEPSELSPVADTTAVPESPLFCPRPDFSTLARDPRCPRHTYELLCDMRDLTELFVTHHDNLDAVYDVESGEYMAVLSPTSQQYDAKIADIRERLAALPSAHTPGLAATKDWVYESCRIASIIYTSAIIMRVPFSVAAEPGRSIIPVEAEPTWHPNSQSSSVRLTDALYYALERSNMQDIWGDMSGVLYWVSLVGAAAARTPASIRLYAENGSSREERFATWVRRCFIMFATRAMIILIFQHPLPIILAQRKMLRVQELVGRGSRVLP